MKEFNLKDFGGVADGKFNNTLAFALAFAEIARNGGGKLVVNSGVWSTGPIDIPSDTTLVLEEGAELSFIPDPNLYPPAFTRWEGVECYAMHPLVFASHAKNVTVTGKGTINGNGQPWWDLKKAKKDRGQSAPEETYEKVLAAMNPGYENQPGGGGGRKSQFLRPPLVQFNNCKNVELSGVKLTNSPCWTVHPVFSTGVKLEGVNIVNPYESPNTDAIDIDSCSDVYVKDCHASVGDDGICVKSGSGEDGVKCNIPTQDVTVENCIVECAHGGAVVGSETAAGIKNITFRDCHFIGTDRGVRIKTRRGRGGHIENIKISNLKVDGCFCPIAFNMYYGCGTTEDWPFDLEKREITPTTPSINRIYIENVQATECQSSAGFIVGLPESVIDDVVIKDCNIQVAENPKQSTDQSEMFKGLPHIEERGIRIRNAKVQLENVKVIGANIQIIRE